MTQPRPPWHEDAALIAAMRGQQVVVLGNGPSATREAIDKLPADAFVIGVNRIARVTDRCDAILVAGGDGVAQVEAERWAKHPPRWILTNACQTRELPDLSAFAVRTFEVDVYRNDPVWPTNIDDPLRRIGQTPPWALQLAILAGASDVFILGVDLSALMLKAAGAKRTHNWTGPADGRKRPTGGSSDKHTIESAIDFYARLLGWARARGVACWNLCPIPDAPIQRAAWPRVTADALALSLRR